MGKASINEVEWETHRATIRSLYVTQKMKLADVMEKMSSEHGFYATKAQYTTHFDLWGDTKKNRDKEYWQGISAALKRRRVDVAEATIYHGGDYLPTKKLKKELKRYVSSGDTQDVNLPATPEGVTILSSMATECHPTTHSTFSMRLDLPWHMCIDSCGMSLPNSGGIQCMTPLRFSPVPSWPDDIFHDFPDFSFASFDLCMPGSGTVAIPDVSIEHFPLAPSQSVQADQTPDEIARYFGLRTQGHSTKLNEELQKHLKPFVVERQPDEMKQAVQELMEPHSFHSFQIMKSYLTLLISNDLITEDAIDSLIRKFNSLEQLSNFQSLLFSDNVTSKAVLNRVLHSTARIGTAEVMEQLLRWGADVNSPSTGAKSQTLLQVALRANNVGVARTLIGAEADVNVGYNIKPINKCFLCPYTSKRPKCRHGHRGADTPLALAAKSFRCVSLISSLLDKGAQIPEKIHVLLDAVSSRATPDEVRDLLSLGADFNQCVLEYWCIPGTALGAAAKNSDLETVRILLEAGAHPDGILDSRIRSKYLGDEYHPSCTSPLMAAVMADCACEDRYTITELLLQHGANCNVSILDQQSMTTDEMIENYDLYDHDCGPLTLYPLQEAVNRNDMRMVKLLITYGAQPNTKYGTPALAIACLKANMEIIRYLLDHGADSNETSQHPHCRSPLEAAVESLSKEVVSILLRAGAQIDKMSADHGGRTALQTAVEMNDQTMTDLLLKHGANVMAPGAKIDGVTAIWGFTFHRLYDRLTKALESTTDLNLECRDGMSPLGAAVVNNDKMALRILINAGACVHEPTSARTPDIYEDESEELDDKYFEICNGARRSPIQWTAALGHIEIARLLCDAGADVNQYPSQNGEHMALHEAVWQGNIAFVRFLITRKVDLNAYSKNKTALAVAAEKKNMDMFELLLRGGADLEQLGDLNSDKTILEDLCSRGSFEIVRELLQAGASAGQGYPLTAYRSFPQSSRNLREIIKILLRYGAEPNAGLFNKHICLQEAILTQNYEIVPLLLDAGADVNAAPSGGKRGFTALQAAASVGDVDTVELLISRGAKINAKPADEQGVTALQAAAIKGFLRVAQILLEHGADVGAEASFNGGRTAIEGAAEFGRTDMVKLLIDNYRGPMSVADCCKIAWKAAKKWKQWYVLELLDTTYGYAENRQAFDEFSDTSSTFSDDI